MLPSSAETIRRALPRCRWTRLTLAVSFVAMAVALLASCGGAPPEILYADAQLFLLEDLASGVVTESLRLYVAVDDSDGLEDLSVISIVNDASELYWQASAEQWVAAEQDGDSWIGLPDIRPVSGREFPRGRYRLILEDESLQETEGSFSITAPPLDAETVSFPSLTVTDGEPAIVAEGAVIVRVFNSTGSLVVSRETSAGPLSEALLREIPEEFGLQVFLYSPQSETIRLVSGPFALDR